MDIRSTSELSFHPRGRVFPSPPDWREQVVYQLLIDRFDDGMEHPAYRPETARRRGDDIKEGRKFQGGNLRGIARRLDYLQGLGVTTVWISPPLKNRISDPKSYHGYGATDFLAVDPRFGTTDDLRALAEALHDRGMYLIMDIVVDHAGDVWAYKDDTKPIYNGGMKYDFGWWRSAAGQGPVTGEPGPNDAIWPVELQRPEAFLRQGRMRDISKTTGKELTDGDFLDLKCFDLSKPEVLHTLIAIYKYWIAVADVDGFRIDAARHMRPEHLQQFTNAIREYARRIGKANFVQVGELAHGGEETRRFISSNVPLAEEKEVANHPLLDATLDFDLSKTGSRVFRGKSPPSALRDRWDLLGRYHRDPALATRSFWAFVENHDVGAYEVRRLLAGVDSADSTAFALRSMAFLLMGPGVPILYYGTEQGFNGDGQPKDVEAGSDAGSDDHLIREAMFGGTWGGHQSQGAHFFNPEHPIYRGIRRLCEIRASFPALRFGRTVAREVGPNILAFGRCLDDQDITVVVNLTAEPWRGWVEVPNRGNLRRIWNEGAVQRETFGATIGLPGLGFEMIVNDL